MANSRASAVPTYVKTNDSLSDEGLNRDRTGFLKYGHAWKTLIPIRTLKQRDKETIPYSNLGLFSFVSLDWMNKILWKASRHGIEKEDISQIREQESTEVNSKRLDRIWTEEKCQKSSKNLSFARAIWRLNRTCLLVAGLAMISMSIFQIAGPALVLKRFLEYLGDDEVSPMWYGGCLVAAMSLCQFVRNVSFNTVWIVGVYAGARAQAAIQMVIYKKVLTIRLGGEKLIAEVINYCTNDMERIFQTMQYSVMLAGAPVMWTINVVYCYIIMGRWSLLGNFLILVYFPIMALVGKMTSQYRIKSIAITDRRIRLMSQVLSSIKLIKMYALEDAFSQKIASIRKEEESILRKACFLQSAGWTGIPITVIICPMVSFIVHVLSGESLTAPVAFTVLTQYTSLIIAVATVPIGVKALSEGIASCQRIQKMLMMPDVIPPNDDTITDSKNAISILGAHLAWPTASSKQQQHQKSMKKTKKNLSSQSRSNLCRSNDTIDSVPQERSELTTVVTDIDLSVSKGELIGICGNVGSGKTTLLSGISGEAVVVIGKVNVSGTIAIVTQQAWLFNAPLLDNIIFGLPYDEQRYNMVVDVCCLSPDFDVLPNGDRTEIGEKGANLSGGQKQRISLARALYSDRDIYLLDDALSAVDAKVARHIFDNCIKIALKEKTVILVTHAMHLLEKCDYVLLMKDGEIVEKGTHQDLIACDGDYQQMFSADKVERDRVRSSDDQITHVTEDENIIVEDAPMVDAVMIKDEVDTCKGITWKTLLYYAKACGGYSAVIFMIFIMVLFNVAILFNNIWLQRWLDAGDGNRSKRKMDDNLGDAADKNQLTTNFTAISNRIPPNEAKNVTLNPDLHMYLWVFGLSALLVVLVGFVKSVIVGRIMLTGSSSLHQHMFSKVIQSPMSFFDTTPLARILNRFSRDMDDLDTIIPYQTEYVCQGSIQLMMQFILIAVLFPWYTFAIAVIVVIYVVMDLYLNVSVREAKRIDNLLRPPILVHITTTVEGLTIIRCFKKQKIFIDKFRSLVDKHLSGLLLFHLSSKWLGFRVDMLSWAMLTSTAVMIWFLKGNVSVGIAGLTMSQILRAAVILAIIMRWKSELQARLISVERITHYCKNLDEEAPGVITDHRPPKNWPNTGNIHFKSVNLRYRENLPLVLQDMTVHINGGEKVGIVGRTGAGKSSIIGVLLRLVEPCGGSIKIDGIDISTIGLKDLRSKIAVIPQDPVIFEGSIRWNLDPFDKHTDEEVWAALDQANLKTKVSNEPKQLETELNSSEGSLSLGEKQLFCLARALLKNSKILILDEATASVDVETDKLIQKTIWKSFAHCTVLAIAHRLNTVMNYERIMTMDSGKVIEFDTPQNLLARNSLFHAMIKSMDDHHT